MSSGIFTPSNQVKLTNVAVVRLKKAGKRFELACYKNKIVDYRNRVSKDLDEVLQTRAVFSNVSKGQLASREDLQAAFGVSPDQEKIIREILDRGELQVSGKEREVQQDALSREVATIIADKCVNPSTRTPYPPALIERALASIHFSPHPGKPAKQQALECIRQLGRSREFPIARARMRLLLDLPLAAGGERIMADLRPVFSVVEQEDRSAEAVRLTVLVEPSAYRRIIEHVAKQSKGAATVLTLSLKEVNEQDKGYL